MNNPQLPTPGDDAARIRAAIRKGEQSLDDPSDVNVLSVLAYGLGIDPLTHAQSTIAAVIHANDIVIAARATTPEAFPGYPRATGPDMVAAKVLGILLDAGWKPPELSPPQSGEEGGPAA